MKQPTRARLGVDDSQLLPRLAVWYRSDKAATDNYSNLALIPRNTPNGANSALATLEQQLDAGRKAAISEFQANLASLGGSGSQNLNAYAQGLKQYASLDNQADSA